MQKAKHKSKETVTLLETVLQLNGTFRRQLEPLGITPLQAGVLLYVHRHPATKITETAEAVAVRGATLSPMIKTLGREGLLTGRRPPHDDRSVYLTLTPHGEALARKILVRLRGIRIEVPTH